MKTTYRIKVLFALLTKQAFPDVLREMLERMLQELQ